MTIYNAPLSFIDKAEIKRYAGLGTTEFDEEMINTACIEVQIKSKPTGIWRIYDYNSTIGEIHCTSLAYIKGEKIKEHLKSAKKIVILAITIGEKVEEEVTNHFKQCQYAYSLLLDAAATAAVEIAADSMEKVIKQYLNKCGYQSLPRFSPGYGDWDITFQSEMLRLSQAEQIDIRLTESYMLIPRKSITAIIGAIPTHRTCTESIKVTCLNCEKINCLARKEI